ncbi:hypothetical protein BGX34_011386 [Mortierella sp. NVP85]|nr:hypothetical protein BGX34_011386 [Mortierella sp. NVP85]
MSAPMPFEPLLASGPSGHNPSQDQEPITTRPRRKLTLSDRIDIFIDRTSGKLGPVLIVTAVILLSMTIYCYFAVFIPFHYPRQPEGEDTASHAGYVANMVWSCYLVWGILANYYYAVNTSPGSVVDGISSENANLYQNVLVEMEGMQLCFAVTIPLAQLQRSDNVSVCPIVFTETPPTCKRCHLPKPERTHHCSVCKKCVLKLQQHCPWIHNCVGHFNHRYFVMFLTYLPIACGYFVYMGIGPLVLLAEREDNTLTAQTTLEQHNNSYIRDECKKKGVAFTNMYDFGVIGNLLDFFNIGRRGHYPWYTAFLPIRIPPIGNGKRFQKSGRGYILNFVDDEDDEDIV